MRKRGRTTKFPDNVGQGHLDCPAGAEGGQVEHGGVALVFHHLYEERFLVESDGS